MKWVFYVIVFVYMAYRAVYGARVDSEISVEKINYGNDTFLRAGPRRAINCRGSTKNQRLEWVDPFGKVIKRVPGANRVYTQEYSITNPSRIRVPALKLIFSDSLAKDSGVYTCKSGNTMEDVPLCVIKPAEFIDTPTEVTAALGRSITLSCKVKGDPEPSLVWARDSEEIFEKNDSSKYKVNTRFYSQGFESILTIMSLEVEDSGLYNCMSKQDLLLNNTEQECGTTEFLNITLNVGYGPIFDNGNDTKAVYGNVNKMVDLVCSADGYPTPTYTWVKAEGDAFAEINKKKIKYSEENNQAVLSIPMTLGSTYICMATNTYGDAEKYFKLLEIQIPMKPKKVKFVESTESQIELKVTWYDEFDFPVKGFQVQYLKTQRKPTDSEWSKAVEIYREVDDNLYAQFLGLIVTIEDLEEDTSYWMRVRPSNDAGDGPWSDPTSADTDIKRDDKPVSAEVSSDGAFYGIFFAGAIAVVVVVSIFIMRLV